MRTQFDGVPAVHAEEALAFEDEEKFVLVLVFVPVEFALEKSKADERVIYRGERLIEPRFMCTGFCRGVDGAKMPKLVVELNPVALWIERFGWDRRQVRFLTM